MKQSSTSVNVKLPNDLYQALIAHCSSLDVTVSQFIRRAVRQAMDISLDPFSPTISKTDDTETSDPSVPDFVALMGGGQKKSQTQIDTPTQNTQPEDADDRQPYSQPGAVPIAPDTLIDKNLIKQQPSHTTTTESTK